MNIGLVAGRVGVSEWTGYRIRPNVDGVRRRLSNRRCRDRDGAARRYHGGMSNCYNNSQVFHINS